MKKIKDIIKRYVFGYSGTKKGDKGGRRSKG